jgi:membrane protein required for colicin V production
VNPLDIGVVAVVGLSAVFAFARGFVREALSVVAWVTAGAITLYGFNSAYAFVDPLVKNPLLSQLIAGFGLFVGSLIILTIITSLISRSVRSSALSPIDRTLGFIFGLLRGALILSLAYLLLDRSLPANDRPVWVREAKSTPYLQQGADLLNNALPDSWKSRSASAIDETIRTVSPAIEAEKARRALSNPTAPAPVETQPPAGPSYRPADRQGMDRLIGTQQ